MDIPMGPIYAGLNVGELLLCAATIVFAGFIRGFLGFGASLIIVMVLSAVVGPAAAIPVAVLSGAVATVQLLPAAVREAERSFMVPFWMTALIASPIGTWGLKLADPGPMKIAISVLVLGMTWLMYKGWRMANVHDPKVFAITGVIAGLLQGGAGVGGPPAVAVALARPGTPDRQRANVIGAVSALSVFALGSYWYHGLYTRDVLLLGLALLPVYSGTTWAGQRLFSGNAKAHYRNAALLALAVIGVVTLALAIVTYKG